MPQTKKKPKKILPKISGHETFTLKYGWIKKIVDEVEKAENTDPESLKDLFKADDSIVRFGIGRNMVNSLKYWATSTSLVHAENFTLTTFSKDFFAADGCDPYLEAMESLWLVHYNLACNKQLVTYNWFFNKYNGGSFDRKSLLNDLIEYFSKEEIRLSSESTLKRDVECFIRMYSSKNLSTTKQTDESIESPLRELGLVKESASKNIFTINREEKLGLSIELAYYMILDFWENSKPEDGNDLQSLSFNALLYDENSIGRICLLNESALNKIILEISEKYSHEISWSDTSGMRQFIKVSEDSIKELKENAYKNLVQKIYSYGLR